MNANPILVTSTRSELVEIKHRGSICVVRADGSVLFQRGNCDDHTYPRSSMKFVQVLPLLETGAVDTYGITETEIALMCASHNSEPRHEQTARDVLAKIGLEERHLRCGTHTPMSEQAFAQLMRAGRDVSAIHNNCSGKHSGFLALAKHLETDVGDYLEMDHPVQTRIRDAVCDVYDTTSDQLHAGVDGCTAPNYAMPLKQMAIGFARLCDPDAGFGSERRAAIAKMQTAILNHPFMVAGTGRFCTELMSAMEGAVIGKLGAAGVYCFGLPGRGIGGAVKIDDGASGPQYTVVTELLNAMGIGSAAAIANLKGFASTDVMNCCQEPIGYRKLDSELFAEFQDEPWR